MVDKVGLADRNEDVTIILTTTDPQPVRQLDKDGARSYNGLAVETRSARGHLNDGSCAFTLFISPLHRITSESEPIMWPELGRSSTWLW